MSCGWHGARERSVTCTVRWCSPHPGRLGAAAAGPPPPPPAWRDVPGGRAGLEAIKQFELGLRLAPKDLFLLHKLALAHLETVGVTGALEVLTSIEKLDADAANLSPEIAGLKGRSYRERWQSTRDVEDLRTARDAYSKPMEFSPDSYYLLPGRQRRPAQPAAEGAGARHRSVRQSRAGHRTVG
jgi:hypothetical protein